MRRIALTETLHGTRDGGITLDARTSERFGLTEREAVTAALLARGLGGPEIAARLDVAVSTVEKHLTSLRRKLGASSTLEAAVTLIRAEGNEPSGMPAAYGLVLPVSAPVGENELGSTNGSPPGDVALAARLRESASLDEMLERVRDDLVDEGIRTLSYTFLPMSAASLRVGDVLHRSLGPDCVNGALACEGAAIAGRLFAEPGRALVFDPTSADEDIVPPRLANACRRAEISLGIALGSPFCAGYVATVAFFRSDRRIASNGADTTGPLVERLRSRLMLLQNVAYSFGTLARTAELTLRERDVLALIASGHSTRTAAEALQISERALGQRLKAARQKLGVATTTQAVAKAMALNALVFL